MATLHVDVVSAEEAIFSGEAKFVVLPGEAGELGILPGHTPLISRIRPGRSRSFVPTRARKTSSSPAASWKCSPAASRSWPTRPSVPPTWTRPVPWKRASALKRRCATPGQGRHRRGRSRARDAGGASRGRAQAAPRRPLALSGRAIGACPGSERSGLWPLFLPARPCLRILACRHLAFTTNSPERSATLAFSLAAPPVCWRRAETGEAGA